MILRKSHLLFLIILAVLTLPLSIGQAQVESEITGVDVREIDGTTEIEILSTAPLTYTMYTSDPYKVVLEMQKADLKGLRKQVFNKAGVTEIVPGLIEGSPDAAKLEIYLTDPIDIKPVQKGGSLLLTFETPAQALDSAEEGASQADEMQVSGNSIDKIALSRSGDKLMVKISGNAEMMARVLSTDNNKIVMDIPNFTSVVEAPSVYEPPLTGIRIGKHSDKTRFVFDLAGPTVYDISPSGSQIVISFNMTGSEQAPSTAETAEDYSSGMSDVTEGKALDILESGQYVGERISLDFQDADLIHVFRLIADISGYNIVVSPEVKGKFSMRLIDVPWDQALEMILKNYDLEKRVDGNIIRIGDRDKFIKEDQEIAKLKESQEIAGELISKTYKINFAKVSEVKKMIKPSARGSVIEDSRTSSLIITDVEDNHARFEDIITTVDKPTPQVNIDARIVEVSKGFAQEFGIQWGANIRPSGDTAIGGLSSTGTGNTSFTSGNPLLINLPAAAGAGTGGAIGFGYLGASALRALDLQLSAMEDTGNGKLISNPRIITLDNEKASIKQGESIPYPGVAEGGGTTTQFVNADLELGVTPHITPDGTIVMEVDIKKNEPDFSKQVNSTPAINTKEAKTKVLIMDGDTLVIGGIFKTTISESENKFPGLGNVPVLGWLFKKKKTEQKTEELLIFITPSIVR